MNFGLPAYQQPPAVAFATSAEMMELRADRLAAHAAKPAATDGRRIVADGRAPEVHALYDSVTGTIYLPEDWSASSPPDVSILVHELVHHIQSDSGATFACPQERERLAYRAQARWLGLTDETMEQAFGLDAMTILVRTNCMYKRLPPRRGGWLYAAARLAHQLWSRAYVSDRSVAESHRASLFRKGGGGVPAIALP